MVLFDLALVLEPGIFMDGDSCGVLGATSPPHRATLIFRRAKKLSAGEKKLIEFLQAVS